jgi:hypothetical protein
MIVFNLEAIVTSGKSTAESALRSSDYSLFGHEGKSIVIHLLSLRLRAIALALRLLLRIKHAAIYRTARAKPGALGFLLVSIAYVSLRIVQTVSKSETASFCETRNCAPRAEEAPMMNHRIRPLVGWSKPSQRLRAEIGPTAPTNMTVMIRANASWPSCTD